MGFFTDDSISATPPALTQERIKAIFDKEEWKYDVDDDGDLRGLWDDNLFYFMLRGEQKEILVVHGAFQRTLPMERLEEVRVFLNSWNRDKIWPKGYHRVMDNGEIAVFCDHASDWEDGVTTEQLAQTLNCALATSLSMYTTLTTELGL